MHTYENFWIVTILRGVLALLIGSGILIVPEMTRTLLFLPFAVAFVVLSLAIYGTADSVLVCVTSFFTSIRSARAALRLQSGLGIVIGLLFCSILFEKIRLEWFLYLIAVQAVAAAFSEFVVARHTSRRHGSRWNYVAAGIALLCAAGYATISAFARESLTPHEISILAYAYLATFGMAQILIAARMLFIEHRLDDVAHARG